MSSFGSDVPANSAPQVAIRQEVGENLGRVIGVQTGAIHGDVYGGDIYEVQVYVLGHAEEPASWARFLDADTPPYKFLAPYSIQDRLLFKGRDREIEQVVRQIGQQQVTVLYAANGVGKTSLLSAGVTPNLISYGALVLQIQDYHQPVQAIRKALLANGQIDLALPEATTLPELAQAVYASTQGSLVLILDQFERFFELPIDDAQRVAFLDALAQSLQALQPDYFRLLISIQEGALGRLEALRAKLFDVGQQPFIRLDALDRAQAQAAIEGPLRELRYPVSFVGDLVAERLAPDLDDLTPAAPGTIQPAQLQIVCSWLYQEARKRHPPHIDLGLYREVKGAEGILARYLQETLETWLAGEHRTAERILEVMANPATGMWVRPEQVSQNGTPPQQVLAILERLAEARLLFRRSSNGHPTYAFASGSVAQEIRRLAGPETRRRYQTEAEVERVWAAWLARDALATRSQLRYLAAAGGSLAIPPTQALLLLRSAVARFEPTKPWLIQLRNPDGPLLIRQLEAPDSVEAGGRASHSTLDKAALLLGVEPAGEEEKADDPFGSLTKAAVGDPDPVVRQTAALALATLGPYEVLDRLNWALRSELQGWRRRARQAELRAALADGDPEFEKIQSDLPIADRSWIRWLRIRQRIVRHRHPLLGVALGGAMGAGLGLGLLRALTQIFTDTAFFTGAVFATNCFYGAILGAALALGIRLSDLLLLVDSKEERKVPSLWRLPLHPDRLPPLLAIALGTLFFGLAYMLVSWFNGMRPANMLLTMPAGLIAGLGLSLAVYDQPRAGWPARWGSWVRRAGLSACFFALAQGLLWLVGARLYLGMVRTGSAYEADFGYLRDTAWWQTLKVQLPWLNIVTLLDAALVGIVLAIGLTAGLLITTDWMARWRTLIEPD